MGFTVSLMLTAGLIFSRREMNVWVCSVGKVETEAQRGDSGSLHRALRGPRACSAAASLGSASWPFLLRESQAFSLDWTAWGETGCPQIRATGSGWGGGQRGVSAQPVIARSPGWSYCVVLSWPSPGWKVTWTQTLLGAGGCVCGARLIHSVHCLHSLIILPDR